MKRIFWALILLWGVVSLHAQKVVEGSFGALAKEKTVILKIDYSESKIDKLTYEAFLEVEEKWDEEYHDIMLKFIKAANENSSGILYSIKKDANYELVFKAISVARSGFTIGYLLLLDKDKNVIGKTHNFNENGGRWGSQTNLMGDCAQRLGKKIAKFIKKQINKADGQ